jgi:hypothetical protein
VPVTGAAPSTVCCFQGHSGKGERSPGQTCVPTPCLLPRPVTAWLLVLFSLLGQWGMVMHVDLVELCAHLCCKCRLLRVRAGTEVLC